MFFVKKSKESSNWFMRRLNSFRREHVVESTAGPVSRPRDKAYSNTSPFIERDLEVVVAFKDRDEYRNAIWSSQC